MRESISYSFLLNIVITFIFVAFAIIIGSLSYYRAFKANSIIAETIEKYEGYNCLSKAEISQKLTNISYRTPFNVNCTENDGNCEANTTFGFKVISYDLDFDGKVNDSKKLYDEPLNSSYLCNENGCTTNKHYQYGIYTYMYVDMPVISQVLRIPFVSRTSTMYEFRNYYVTNNGENTQITEVESIFDQLYDRKVLQDGALSGKTFITDAYMGKKVTNILGQEKTNVSAMEHLSYLIQLNYVEQSTGQKISEEHYFINITNDASVNKRTRLMIELLKGNAKGQNGNSTALNYLITPLNTLGKDGGNNRRQCGYHIDYGSINF